MHSQLSQQDAKSIYIYIYAHVLYRNFAQNSRCPEMMPSRCLHPFPPGYWTHVIEGSVHKQNWTTHHPAWLNIIPNQNNWNYTDRSIFTCICAPSYLPLPMLLIHYHPWHPGQLDLSGPRWYTIFSREIIFNTQQRAELLWTTKEYRSTISQCCMF